MSLEKMSEKETFLFPWQKLEMDQEINLWLQTWRDFVEELKAIPCVGCAGETIEEVIKKYNIHEMDVDGFKRINIDKPKVDN
jgi:acetyl-CoA acetyltransferase